MPHDRHDVIVANAITLETRSLTAAAAAELLDDEDWYVVCRADDAADEQSTEHPIYAKIDRLLELDPELVDVFDRMMVHNLRKLTARRRRSK